MAYIPGSNARIVAIARQISSFDFRAASLRAQAERAEDGSMAKQKLEQDACEFDNEICSLCHEIRKIVNGVA